ncbi:hypothetical protein PQX77_003653 [Marasmius sp. AFHP31]|nr:hypothetical protein PQX77_003653 [Marasmius sp. AFHP31]
MFLSTPPDSAPLHWNEDHTLQYGTPTSSNQIKGLLFSPDSRFLAVGLPTIIEIWQISSLGDPPKPPLRIRANHELVCMTWLGPRTLAHGHRDGRVGVSTIEDEVVTMKVLQAGTTGHVSSFALLGDGRILAIGIGDEVNFWEFTNTSYEWRSLGSLPNPPNVDQISRDSLVVTSLFTVNASTLLVSYADSAVILWSLSSTNPIEATAASGIRVTGRVYVLPNPDRRAIMS